MIFLSKFFLAILVFSSCGAVFADTKNTISIGYAKVQYNNSSTELTNSPIPLTAAAKDHSVIATTYDYHFTRNWSIQLAGGLPPTVKIESMGQEIGEAKGLFPAVIGIYNLNITTDISIYAGLGINYTKFYDKKIYSYYTENFLGESSTSSIDDDIGFTKKIGVKYNINKKWVIDLSYAKYPIVADTVVTTTYADGSNIERAISVDVSPDIYTILFGYKF